MTNPVAKVYKTTHDNKRVGSGVWTWCPGCDMVHRFQIVGEDGSQPDGPTWSWDGNLEAPTFSPSMLVYESADVCPPDYEHYRPCDDPDCAEAHALIDDVPSHFKGHVAPRGNCHSFLKNGQWEFLSDSAHKLAGQTVPMVPLPDWLVR